LALLLIVAVLLVARHLAEPVRDWLGAQTQAIRTTPRQQAVYATVARELDAEADRRRREADASGERLRRATEAQLNARRAELERGLDRSRAARLEPAPLALAAARGDSAKVAAHYRAGLEIALAERERRLIDALLDARAADRSRLSLDAERRLAEAELRDARQAETAARRRVEALENRFLADARDAICRLNPTNLGCENHRALLAARRAEELAAERGRAADQRLRRLAEAERALARVGGAVESAAAVISRERAKVAAEQARLETAAGSNPTLTAWRLVADVLPTALLILLLAIASPILLKALLYFGVAPLAERRPPIRLAPSDRGEVTLTSSSAVSQRVRLEPGQELLVQPRAVQSSPHQAAKRTRWLFKAALPLSSLASGLYALTEIRTRSPDTVLVSAIGGPLAEIVLVRVERGSGLVVRPRALRGLVQPIDEPVRIDRRWRLGLSAWLTLQFRYLIFNGPCTLIVEGARGVRLEPTGPGRGSNQAATLGFSAGVAYGVARSETFGAYLMGQQALFNDSFRDARGAHLQEEAPFGTVQANGRLPALRGVGDALLRLVGL
jgi:hypothetical protein